MTINLTDIFADDAFSVINLTNTINEMESVPSRAGEVAFAGAGMGIPTYTAAIESISGELNLVQTSARGAPSAQEVGNKRKMRHLEVPQVKIEQTIPASLIQNVREFGSNSLIAGPQTVVAQQMTKMNQRLDLMLEYMRLGALKGVILDADGSTELLDLFAAFDVDQLEPVALHDVLVGQNTDYPTVRAKCHEIARAMRRGLKGLWPGGASIHAFAGDNLFDRLTDCASVVRTYDGYALAEQRLGANYAHGVFLYGGIYWENYVGTDDNSTVAIDADEAIIFPVGIPGLYQEYYAPADFLDTANTIGIPRYARMAPDAEMNRFLKLHVQMNPLPICMRPQVLLTATIVTG